MRRRANGLEFLPNALVLLVLFLPVPGAGQGTPDRVPSVSDLIAAIRASDGERVGSLLCRGADPGGRDADGMTPLHYSAYKGGLQVALRLLAAGADPEARDSLGLRPLHAAAFSGRTEVARILIGVGATVDSRDYAGMSPLHYAAANGNREVAELLIASGADLRLRSGGGLTPSEEASAADHPDLAALLAPRGNSPQSTARTPGPARTYTDDDLADVRSRNRFANEDQLTPPKPPTPGTQGSNPATEATEATGSAGAKDGPFQNAFQQGLWNEDIEGAVRFAKEVKRPLLALFTGSDWCHFCKLLEAGVLSTDTFRRGVKGKYVLLYVDFPRKKPVAKEILSRRRDLAAKYGVQAYPTLVVLAGDRYLDCVRGFTGKTDPEQYLSRIEQIAR